MQTKKSRPVLQHHGGKGKTFAIILPLLREAVKLAEYFGVTVEALMK